MIGSVVLAAGLLLGHGSAVTPSISAPVYNHGIESDAAPETRVYNVTGDGSENGDQAGWLLHWTFTCPDDTHGFVASVRDGSEVIPVNEWGMNGSGEMEGGVGSAEVAGGNITVWVVTVCRWRMWVSEG